MGGDLSPEPKLPPDHIVSGRFRIIRFLGAGAMGEVYEAEDSELGGRVALKTIRPHLREAQTLSRFRREIQVARQVTHPNVCRVFDVGRDAFRDQELVYFTMEFLNGETLLTWIQKEKRAAVDLIPVCRQIADGLDALHEKGIVHRDLKPGNVMLVQGASGPRAVLGDFGLAREVGSELETATQTQGIVGTPGYMAPEVLAGLPATPASDIWAFGLVLHELATGKLVAAGQKLDSSLPANWSTVIHHCLTTDPMDRPASASAVLTELTSRPPFWRRNIERVGLAVGVVLIAAVIGWLIPALRTKTQPPGPNQGMGMESVRGLLARSYRPGNLASAIATLEGAVKSRPDSAYEHSELGDAYLLRFEEKQNPSDLELARQQSARAMAIDPELTQPHLTEASLYLRQGRTDLAQAQIQQVLSLNRNNPAAYAAQAELMRAEGRPADAEAALQRAIDLAPEDWHWHYHLGAFYRFTGKFDKAAAEFEAALRLAPDNPNALGNLAGVYLQQSLYEEARITFLKAIAVDPQYRFYSGLGATLMLEGKYSDATGMFRKAVDLNPQSYIAWANIGSAYSWTTGQKDQAAGAYREAIRLGEAERKLQPNDATLLVRLGDYYAAIGDAGHAILLVRQALALQADSPEVTYTAAEAYEILHYRDEALRWMTRSVKLGYPVEYIQRSPELAGMRSDPRFKLVLGQKKR